MDALGCTREEARTLHSELLRRKVVLPVAGLAAGVAALGRRARRGSSRDAPYARVSAPAKVAQPRRR